MQVHLHNVRVPLIYGNPYIKKYLQTLLVYSQIIFTTQQIFRALNQKNI